jgi:hypothetical protein
MSPAVRMTLPPHFRLNLLVLKVMICSVITEEVSMTTILNMMNSISPDGMNLTIVLDMTNRYITPDVADSTIVLEAMNGYATPDWAYSTIVPNTMNGYATPNWADSTIARDMMDCYVTPDLWE